MTIIDIKKNELEFPHAVCSLCHGNKFHIIISDSDNPESEWVMCSDCGTMIAVELKPIWSKGDPTMKELKTYIIQLILCFTMLFVSGCSTMNSLPIKIQVVGDEELAAIDDVAITTITEVVKAKYPSKIKSLINYCDLALAATDDDMFEAYFNNGIQMLPDQFIRDPVIRGATKGLLKSFKIEVITGDIDFDMGAIRRAKRIVESFRAQLGG